MRRYKPTRVYAGGKWSNSEGIAGLWAVTSEGHWVVWVMDVSSGGEGRELRGTNWKGLDDVVSLMPPHHHQRLLGWTLVSGHKMLNSL